MRAWETATKRPRRDVVLHFSSPKAISEPEKVPFRAVKLLWVRPKSSPAAVSTTERGQQQQFMTLNNEGKVGKWFAGQQDKTLSWQNCWSSFVVQTNDGASLQRDLFKFHTPRLNGTWTNLTKFWDKKSKRFGFNRLGKSKGKELNWTWVWRWGLSLSWGGDNWSWDPKTVRAELV